MLMYWRVHSAFSPGFASSNLRSPDFEIGSKQLRPSPLLAPEVRLLEVWAWSMYDFANSGYTTVVITAIFGAYFVGAVAGNADWATFAWTCSGVSPGATSRSTSPSGVTSMSAMSV